MNIRLSPILFFLTIFVWTFSGCHCSKKAANQAPPEEKVNIIPMATAPALVYKTRKDYSKYVPVLMNTEKTHIVSYPHPSDLYFRGKLAYPTSLNGGYFLDNRGIGPNVAFLDFTYESYSQLKKAPTMEELMSNILDKDPLLNLWDCGARDRFSDEVTELNDLIEKGFPGCNQLVIEYKVRFN